MPEVVRVSSVETGQKLSTLIEGYFKKGRFAEITQAIGMHSILMKPEHMLEDQSAFYHSVLKMMKAKIAEALASGFSGWYAHFPDLMDELVTTGQIVANKLSAETLASRRAAFGPFRSVDDFFFWSLDDRRLTLDQIMKYLEKTAERFKR